MFAKNANGRPIKAHVTPTHFARLPTKAKVIEDKPLADEDRMEAPEITPGAITSTLSGPRGSQVGSHSSVSILADSALPPRSFQSSGKSSNEVV